MLMVKQSAHCIDCGNGVTSKGVPSAKAEIPGRLDGEYTRAGPSLAQGLVYHQHSRCIQTAPGLPLLGSHPQVNWFNLEVAVGATVGLDSAQNPVKFGFYRAHVTSHLRRVHHVKNSGRGPYRWLADSGKPDPQLPIGKHREFGIEPTGVIQQAPTSHDARAPPRNRITRTYPLHEIFARKWFPFVPRAKHIIHDNFKTVGPVRSVFVQLFDLAREFAGRPKIVVVTESDELTRRRSNPPVSRVGHPGAVVARNEDDPCVVERVDYLRRTIGRAVVADNNL